MKTCVPMAHKLTSAPVDGKLATSPPLVERFYYNLCTDGAEVKIMIDTAYARAQTILINNMPKLDKVAERLLEKEIISAEEFQELIK